MTTKKFDLQTWLANTGRDVRRDGERIRSVAVRRHFDAPIERVWTAWVEGWKTKIARGEPRPGETVELDLGGPTRVTCKILACEAPTLLAVTWVYGEPTEMKPDEVTVRMSSVGDRTLLELEHRSEAGATWAPGVGAGWEAGILMFELMLEGGDLSVWPETHAPLDKLWVDFVGEKAAS